MKPYYLLAAGLILLTCSFTPKQKEQLRATAKQEDSSIKAKAFSILETKCNFCHNRQNPRKVFTSENMDGHAGNIYRQVFVWRRMPKNNAVTLSSEEQETLKRWLRLNTRVKD